MKPQQEANLISLLRECYKTLSWVSAYNAGSVAKLQRMSAQETDRLIQTYKNENVLLGKLEIALQEYKEPIMRTAVFLYYENAISDVHAINPETDNPACGTGYQTDEGELVSSDQEEDAERISVLFDIDFNQVTCKKCLKTLFYRNFQG